MRKRNEIIKRWPEKLTMEQEMEVLFSEDQVNLSDYDANEMAIAYACLLCSRDVDTGSSQELLVLCDDKGVLYATISPTFIDTFVTISSWLIDKGKKLTKIQIKRDQSKKGREFMTCKMLSYTEV